MGLSDGEPGIWTFVTAYEDHPFVTPRMAYRLWEGAHCCADTWRLAEGDAGDLADELPPIVRPYATGVWLERFIASFINVAERIERGEADEEHLTNCTGEEMAVHLIIDRATAEFESGIEPSGDEIDLLPDHGEADEDFERMRDLLLRDGDVLLLFNASLDGIEDPDGELAQVGPHREPSPAAMVPAVRRHRRHLTAHTQSARSPTG